MKLKPVREWRIVRSAAARVWAATGMWCGLASFMVIEDVNGYRHSGLVTLGVAAFAFQRVVRRLMAFFAAS